MKDLSSFGRKKQFSESSTSTSELVGDKSSEILKSKLNKSKLKNENEINKELLELINRENSIKVNEKNLSLLGIIIEPFNLDIEKLNKYFLITDIINM